MALIKILESKIHAILVTEANLKYIGSITLDVDFLEQVGIQPYSEVFIVNNNNGERIETYVIPGERGKKDVCLNGAAARKFEVGDEIIIMAFKFVDKKHDIDKIDKDYQPNVFLAEYLLVPKGTPLPRRVSGLRKLEITMEEMNKIWK